MEITKMLTISNGHVSDETWQRLAREAEGETDKMPMAVYEKGNYGFLISCACMFNEENEGIPNDLLLCMKLAHECGCMWLCLDDDGELLSCLPRY